MAQRFDVSFPSDAIQAGLERVQVAPITGRA